MANLKIPIESSNYRKESDYAIKSIGDIIDLSIKNGDNKIIINTNLKLGLPMENINKIAGPFVEAWAQEKFTSIVEGDKNIWNLTNVESTSRLNRADIILQFKTSGPVITAEVDVKATAEDLFKSGKSPNITSFSRIRTAYVEDPDFLFVILSLKHRVYSTRNKSSNLMDGVMEIVNQNTYDIKYLSDSDINYNPALGTGQIQIKDIHYVSLEYRTAADFIDLLDRKYLASSKRTQGDWNSLAIKNKWIK